MLRCSNLGYELISIIYQIPQQIPHCSKGMYRFENRFTCHPQHLTESHIKVYSAMLHLNNSQFVPLENLQGYFNILPELRNVL